MSVRKGIALFCMVFHMSAGLWGFENADLRLAPSIGWSFFNVEAESSYGESSEIGMHDVSYGMDLYLLRQTANPDLLLGGSMGYQFMTRPFSDDSGLGDNPDLSVSSFFVGPGFTYYLDEWVYLLGTFGLALLWTSGGDDFMDTTIVGPGFSFGGGYDFQTEKAVRFGVYGRLAFSFLFGEDSEAEVEYTGSHITPTVGVSALF